MTHRSDRASAFRALHIPGTPLVLPDAWDAVSARLVKDAGAAAGATTRPGSSGHSARRTANGWTATLPSKPSPASPMP
jgi:2-methylisocitrate lyase-like PEP mutase family enzyme